MVREINSIEEFDSAIASGVVYVDFYSQSCSFCKLLEKEFDKYPDLNIVKVDIYGAGNAGISSRYGIMGLPAMIKFDNGAIAEDARGYASALNLLELSKNN